MLNMAMVLFMFCFLIYGSLSEMLSSATILPYSVKDAENQQIIQLLNDLNNRVNQLESMHDTDSKIINSMQEEIFNLKRENGILEERMENIESSITKTVVPVTDGEEKKGSQESYRKQSKTANLQSLMKQNHGNKKSGSQIRQIAVSLQPPVVADEEKFAFHATVASAIKSPNEEDVIPFANMITNIGDAYSNTTGVFTCPHDGTYVFSWTAATFYEHVMDTHLVRNGVMVGFTSSGDADYASTGGGTVVLQLDRNDRVWVKVGHHSNGAGILPYFSMFSGFKLY